MLIRTILGGQGMGIDEILESVEEYIENANINEIIKELERIEEKCQDFLTRKIIMEK